MGKVKLKVVKAVKPKNLVKKHLIKRKNKTNIMIMTQITIFRIILLEKSMERLKNYIYF